jgi:hypothetical protein
MAGLTADAVNQLIDAKLASVPSALDIDSFWLITNAEFGALPHPFCVCNDTGWSTHC